MARLSPFVVVFDLKPTLDLASLHDAADVIFTRAFFATKKRPRLNHTHTATAVPPAPLSWHACLRLLVLQDESQRSPPGLPHPFATRAGGGLACIIVLAQDPAWEECSLCCCNARVR